MFIFFQFFVVNPALTFSVKGSLKTRWSVGFLVRQEIFWATKGLHATEGCELIKLIPTEILLSLFFFIQLSVQVFFFFWNFPGC